MEAQHKEVSKQFDDAMAALEASDAEPEPALLPDDSGEAIKKVIQASQNHYSELCAKVAELTTENERLAAENKELTAKDAKHVALVKELIDKWAEYAAEFKALKAECAAEIKAIRAEFNGFKSEVDALARLEE